LRQIDRLHADLLARTEAAAAWQARAELLAGELAHARQQLALQAPQANPTPEEPPAAAPAEERPRASWWRRVLLGE
jgi:hypothetical protein